MLVELLMELLLGVDQGRVQVIEASLVALCFRFGELGGIVFEADAVAEESQISCMFDLFECFDVEDVLLAV